LAAALDADRADRRMIGQTEDRRMTTPLPIDQMIDLRRGTISREIFVSPEFYREELDRLFTRAWLFVGHESLIPKPGDFYVSRMGEESVILCRDAQGAVHVFLNSCRHRGMKVCRYEQGNTSLFVCPYHSWSYTTDGKLQGVPLYRALYDGTLNREEWSLIEVPKLALYKGTVWASWILRRRTSWIISAARSITSTRCWIAATAGLAGRK
jgi:nitrite reductase/ring-hydroxylating ferredoxin subunit